MQHYNNKYEHNNLRDLDFFEQHRVEKVPLQTVEHDMPQMVDNAFGLVFKNGDLASDTAVSGSYALTNHSDLYNKHADLVFESSLPHQNIAVVDEITPNGLKARRSIQYLDTARDVSTSLNHSDPVYCRSDVINSVNQTWAFQMFSGAYRSFCENSMVFGGDKVGYWKQKHSKHFDAGSILSTANSTLADYEANCEKFVEWKKIPVTDGMAMKFLGENFCTYPDAEIEKRAAELVGASTEDIKYNKKKLASLLVLWNQYKEQLGCNKWALYNAITHYATHTHETYTVVVEDKHGNSYETEHTTGRLTKNTPTCQQSPNGLNYTLSEQHDRSRLVACIIMKPEFQKLAA